MEGNIVSVESFLQNIRAFDSPNREALPQRSQRDIVDSLRHARDINSAMYFKQKDHFIQNELFKNYPDTPGIYFFLRAENEKVDFFYIGISGTVDEQAAFLKERLRKHMITFDYFFYTLAFPNNYQIYYDDCIQFYGSGIYKGKMKTYVRQFSAIAQVGFNYIAWIGDSAFNPTMCKAIESHFIAIDTPPANGDIEKQQRKLPLLSQYKSKYEEVRNYLFDVLIPRVSSVNKKESHVLKYLETIKPDGQAEKSFPERLFSESREYALRNGFTDFCIEETKSNYVMAFFYKRYTTKKKIFIYSVSRVREGIKVFIPRSIPEPLGIAKNWETKPALKRKTLLINNESSVDRQDYVIEMVKHSIDFAYKNG